MAENQQDRAREDLTEEASPYRIEEYRRKGMVSQSRELSGLLALLATGVVAYAISPKIGVQLAEFMREVFRTDLSARADLGSGTMARQYLERALYLIGALGLPICLAGFVFGVIGSFSQIGPIFTFEPLTPDFKKINPLAGFQRLLSVRQGIESLRLVLKTAVVLVAAYYLVRAEVFSAPAHLGAEAGTLLGVYGSVASKLFLSLFSIVLVFAVLDFVLQRMEYSKSIRMTKQEAKQEHKEREGDPQIKARIRAVQREVARRRMMQAVKKANVIVTNPTHIAIALQYDKDSMFAPKVVAKGADHLAQRIKKVAAEAGVPLVENVPLARTLYKSVKINQYIPRTLYQAVAEVLAYVYRLRNRGV